MSLNTLPIDINREKLRDLLERLSNRTLQRKEAEELVPLLERIWNDAIKQGDASLASELAQILIALDDYIHGRVNIIEIIPIREKLDAKKIQKDERIKDKKE
jgi:hypothetical protein